MRGNTRELDLIDLMIQSNTRHKIYERKICVLILDLP